MRPVNEPGPRMARIHLLAAGLCLTVATTAAAPGQEIDPLYDGLAAGDVMQASAVLQETLETHQSQETAEWRSEATNHSGTITPLRTFRIAGDYFCRDFRETVTTTSSLIERIGTACRREDGVWIRVER